MTAQASKDKTQPAKGLFRRMIESLETFGREVGAGILLGYVLGVLTYIACFVIAFRMPPYEEWWLNVLLCLFGGIVGWSLGVLLSPMTREEEGKFTGYGRALSAFASGFLIAKLDLLLKSIPTNLNVQAVVLIGRALLFGTALFVGFQFTFVVRWRSRPAATPRRKPWQNAPRTRRPLTPRPVAPG
jgi:hypothetical protein